MKITLLPLVLLTLAIGAQAAPPAQTPVIPTNAPASIELRDQFDAPQKLSFPNTNLTVLIIADRKGSEQINGWIAALKEHFAKRIDIRGLADVSGVPRLLRGTVQSSFAKSQSFPVMMDWSGSAVKALTYVPDNANLLLLDGRGHILRRLSGPATPKLIADLSEAIDRALASRPQESSAH